MTILANQAPDSGIFTKIARAGLPQGSELAAAR
jgi:hypothetical protein